MARLCLFSLCLLSLSAGCASRPAPPMMGDIGRFVATADGARVRVRDSVGDWKEGEAQGWPSPSPIVVTDSGDTVHVTCATETQVTDPEADSYVIGGLIGGALAGLPLMQVGCHGGSHCGEQNPLPGLAIIVGAVIGRSIPREGWVGATRPGCGFE